MNRPKGARKKRIRFYFSRFYSRHNTIDSLPLMIEKLMTTRSFPIVLSLLLAGCGESPEDSFFSKNLNQHPISGENHLGKSADQFFANSLLDSDGKKVSSKVLESKTVGLYFSAHWCPPCRTFTPKLVKFRNDNLKDFEVVFISSDNSAKDQLAYMKKTGMKWYTLEHDSSLAISLASKFEIHGIPALVILSPRGKTITKNGQRDVSSNANGALKAWVKKSS